MGAVQVLEPCCDCFAEPVQAENEALQELLLQLAADKAAAQKQLSELQSTFVPSATGGQ